MRKVNIDNRVWPLHHSASTTMAMYPRLNIPRSINGLFRGAKTRGLCCLRWTQMRFGALAIVLFIAALVNAQIMPDSAPDKSSMHQHYDAAYRFQSSGDLARADLEHARFLVAALKHIANFNANTGDYAHAAPLYDEALALAPADFALLMDYAGASLDAHDPKKAKSLLHVAGGLNAKDTTGRQKADMHRMLGSALRALGNTNAAIEEFHAAIAMDPTIENLCALGDAVLEANGPRAAAAIFAKVVEQFGDTAAVRMRIGRIYGLAGVPDQAIEEFKKAVAMDPKVPGAHYSLGAAYMGNSAADFPKAEAEFRKELALYPNDAFSYAQLGQIALRRRDYHGAELDYKRAATLNPLDAENFDELGKIYLETERPSDAEAAMRKAIALTVDPASNNYAIQRAHYRLGRLLLANGDSLEGERELQISQELLAKRDVQVGSKLSGEQVERSPLERTRVATPTETQEATLFAKQTGPLIAASYNNLGVHAAMKEEFAKAAGYFQAAAKWNPTLSGVDSNWGRAAFAAHECEQAISPIRRALAAHPSDSELRAILDECASTPSTH
jgi:tetratricopeptide (TPR) repeat protein